MGTLPEALAAVCRVVCFTVVCFLLPPQTPPTIPSSSFLNFILFYFLSLFIISSPLSAYLLNRGYQECKHTLSEGVDIPLFLRFGVPTWPWLLASLRSQSKVETLLPIPLCYLPILA